MNPEEDKPTSPPTSEQPPSPAVFSYNEQQVHKRKHRRAVVVFAVTMFVFAVLGSTALWNKPKAIDTVSKKEAAQTAAPTASTQETTKESVASQPTPVATEPALDEHPTYPEDAREAFIKQCVSYKNKESTCVCNINYIQQRYTIDEYTIISQNPESHQYEEMVAAAYDNNDCT
jgi:hypothetical protein